MDRQKPDSDILQAAKEAQAFNDNLSHEVRVAADLEPIMHIGEFPTSLKIDPLPGYQAQQNSGLKEKLEQMAEKEQPFQLPVGWQDDENLYNKVIDLLVTLDPEEQADLLYKILKNEKRSNRSRLVQRIKRIIQMMEAGDLAIDIDKLHEICVRVKLEMEIEEALRDELGIDLDPIRQQVLDEDERLMDEMAQLAEEEIIEQKELPIEYAPPIRKGKYIKEVNKNYLKQKHPLQKEEDQHLQQGEEESHEMVLKNIVFKHPKSQPRLQKHHHEEPNFKLNEDDIFYLIDEGYIPENVFDDLEHHRNINVEQFILDNLLNNEQMDLRIIKNRKKRLHNPRFQSAQRTYLIPKNPLPDEHYLSHRNIQIPQNRKVKTVGGNLQYEQMHPLERQINQPLDTHIQPNYEYIPQNDQDYLNVGINKKEKDPYFNYVKLKPKREYISHDVAQSINIVQGETQKQSINIVKNDGPVQSINIAFDETQAELNKQQELYHMYRNQKHFIDRDSFRFPQDPQYPDIHTGTILDKPPKPYLGEKVKKQYVPQGPNERFPSYRPPIDQFDPLIPDIYPVTPIQPLVPQKPFRESYPFPIPPYGYQPIVPPYRQPPPYYSQRQKIPIKDHRIGVTITEDLPVQGDTTSQVEIQKSEQKKESKKHKKESNSEAEKEEKDQEKAEGEEKNGSEENAEGEEKENQGEEKAEGEEKVDGEENQKGEEENKNDGQAQGFGQSVGQNALQQCLPQCMPQETNDEISINVTVKKNSKTGGYQVGVNHGKKEEEESPAEEKGEEKAEEIPEKGEEKAEEKAEENSQDKADEASTQETILAPEITDPYYEYFIYCQQYFQDPICSYNYNPEPPVLNDFGIPPQQLDEDFVPYLPPPQYSQERYHPNDPRNFGFYDPDRKKYIETPNEVIEQEDQQLRGIQRPMKQQYQPEQEVRYQDEAFDEQYYEEDYYEEYQEDYYSYPIYDPRYQREEEPYRNFRPVNPKKKNDQMRYSLKRLKERMKKDKEVRDRQKRLKEFHVYGDYEWYKLHRKVYDKRKKDEIYQDSRRDADVDDIQDRKLLIRDLDQDDDEYYEKRKDKKKKKFDTAGKEFVKSLQKQEEKEQDEKESQKKLEEMGLEKKKKSKQKQKSKSSTENDGGGSQEKNKNRNDQKQDDDEDSKQSKANDDEGGLQKLASNKQNNIADKDSLVKPQSKQTNKQNRKQDIDENEPNLKHQARGNSEKKQENKDLGKDEEPLLNKGSKSKAKTALIQMQDLSCSTATDRARLFVCNECQSNMIYRLDDDSWYLIGLAQGYKKEFHQIFKMLKTLINPQSLYTTFSKNNQICFSSSIKQKINLNMIVNLLIGKNISQSLITFPQNMTMTYFQLKFSQISNTSNYFILEIQDQINQQLPGIFIKSVELIWNDQFRIKYNGLIHFTNAQRKFQYEIIENNDKIETIQIFLTLPHDLSQIVIMFKTYFSQEYLMMFETYLYQQNKKGPAILQIKQREADKQYELSFNLKF